MLGQTTVAAHDPDTGAVLWEQPFSSRFPHVSSPIVLPADRVLASAGYGIGSKLYQVSPSGRGLAASLLWESPRLKSKFANLVAVGDHVYGLDDGVFTCIDARTGDRVWKSGRYGHGQLLLVSGAPARADGRG